MQPIMTAIAVLVSAVCGAAIGVLFTVAHRATFALADLDVPYGIILGLVSVVAFLAAMRLLWSTRWPAFGGAVGFIAAIVALAYPNANDSLIVVDDGLGWTWLILAPIAALTVLVWPRRRRRRHAAGRLAAEGDGTIEGPEKPLEEYP